MAQPQTQTQCEKIASNTHRKIYPLEFYRAFLDREVRPDGRALRECRRTEVRTDCVSTADGSANVRMGATTVLCGIKLEVAAPRSPNVKDGFVEISVILSPLCSASYHSLSLYESDAVSQSAAALSRALCDIVVGSGMFSLSSLCIESERAVWKLCVDVLCVCDDGNVFDVALIAVAAALRSLRIPSTVFAKDKKEVLIDDGSAPYALALSFDLLPLTLAVLDGKLIADPTRDEQSLADDLIRVVLTDKGDLAHIHKHGKGASMHSLTHSQSLKALLAIAAERAKELKRILKEACQGTQHVLQIDFDAVEEKHKEQDEADGDSAIMMNVD